MEALNALLQSLGRFFRWWVLVCPWERCIRVRGGKRQRELSPGVHFLIPFLDRAFIHSVRLRLSNIPAQTLTRQDGSVLTVRGVLKYKVADLSLLYREVHNAEDAVLDRTAGLIAVNREVGAEALEVAVLAAADYSDWGLVVEGFTVTDFVISRRSYRLLTDKMTEHPWGSKLNTSGDGARGRGHP